MIIGIDIGSTTTKAVSIENGSLKKMVKTKAFDAVTSAAGALGKLVHENGIKINSVKKIMITGVGASAVKSDIFDIPTAKVNEIEAIGIGGMFLAGKSEIIITNIGTGTVIVEAGSKGISHFGGSGVGGGTILGLAKKLTATTELSGIMDLAFAGNLNNVDLRLADIMDGDISFLSKDTTAANFGKALDCATSNDLALAVVNMVFEVIGVMSVFAAKARDAKRVIVTGNGSGNQIGQNVFNSIGKMYGIEFIYPEYAEYTTAVGAALHCGGIA